MSTFERPLCILLLLLLPEDSNRSINKPSLRHLLAPVFAVTLLHHPSQHDKTTAVELATCSHPTRTSRIVTASHTKPVKQRARSSDRSVTSNAQAESSHNYHSSKLPQQRVQHQARQLRRKCSVPSTVVASSDFASNLNSAIVTISVGPSQRLFAAHEDVLCKSQYFSQAVRAQFFESNGKRIDLPNEEPEVFSSVLEYLYKGDYTPKLAYDKKRASWYLEDSEGTSTAVGENAVYHNGVGGSVLKDTIIYVCELLTITTSSLTSCSVQLIVTHYQSCNVSRSRSKAYNPASNAALSYRRHASPTPTHPPTTASCEPTTSLSSSAAATPSSVAAPCKWRWRTAARRCSSTCSSPWSTIW